MYIIAKYRLATTIVRSFIECFVKLQSDPVHHGVKPFLNSYLYFLLTLFFSYKLLLSHNIIKNEDKNAAFNKISTNCVTLT